MEIGNAERIFASRHAEAVGDGPLIDALARGEDAAGEIGDRADFQLAQILGARRKINLNLLRSGICSAKSIPPPLRPVAPTPRWSGACNR